MGLAASGALAGEAAAEEEVEDSCSGREHVEWDCRDLGSEGGCLDGAYGKFPAGNTT